MEGRQERRQEGIELSRMANIRNVMKGLKYTAQQAMELLKIPDDDRPKYLVRL